MTASIMLDGQTQNDLDFRSCYLSAEPKNQIDALSRPDAHFWKESEIIEIKTVCDMGTFELVDEDTVPEGTVCLPTKFTYKLKVKPDLANNTETIRRKARIVIRGDLQFDHEFDNVFAPTSKFTAVRTIISLATQQNLKLKSWDIQVLKPLI